MKLSLKAVSLAEEDKAGFQTFPSVFGTRALAGIPHTPKRIYCACTGLNTTPARITGATDGPVSDFVYVPAF